MVLLLLPDNGTPPLYPQSSVLSATIEILSALIFVSCDAPGAIIRCSAALLFDFLRWNMPLPSTLVVAAKQQPSVFLLSTFSIEIEIEEEKVGDDLHNEEVRVVGR